MLRVLREGLGSTNVREMQHADCPQKKWREEMSEYEKNVDLWESKIIGGPPGSCYYERETHRLREENRRLRAEISLLKTSCLLPDSYCLR